eukprot:CAMPEP_0184500378 /NCGR_PEP_ID=MMETSP0113_2-20130426/44573_1 /TAXON_ID=91329 /ORGANISM="Norrisiella sphaerica, Strain BC52" /LENGTH=200 /DNA_ID=CAMNT_0026888721 /DNA_START=274 /DNA_END=873 /DNA_ORIENTATION=-
MSPYVNAKSSFARKVDLGVLEADLMEDEEPDDDAQYVMERGKDGKLHPTGPALGPSPEMLFVTLKSEYDTEEKCQKVAGKWAGLLWTIGLEIRPFPIGDNRLLFVIHTGMGDVQRFKDFALEQEETDHIEHKQQKSYPGKSGQGRGANGNVDMEKIRKMLAKQGIQMGDDAPVRKSKKRKGKTKRQKREEKKKRMEQKKL